MAVSTISTLFGDPLNFLIQNDSKSAPWCPSFWGSWCNSCHEPIPNPPKLCKYVSPITFPVNNSSAFDTFYSSYILLLGISSSFPLLIQGYLIWYHFSHLPTWLVAWYYQVVMESLEQVVTQKGAINKYQPPMRQIILSLITNIILYDVTCDGV